MNRSPGYAPAQASGGDANDGRSALTLIVTGVHKRAIVRMSVATLIVTAAGASRAWLPLPHVPGFFPAITITTAIATLLTAHFFLSESRRLGSVALGTIGLTYLAVGWLTLASFFTFPGNVTAVVQPWQSPATAWLAAFRIMVAPLGLALYGMARKTDLAGSALTFRSRAFAAGRWRPLLLHAVCAALVVAIAVAGATFAPGISQGNHPAASFRPLWIVLAVLAAVVCWQLYRRVRLTPNLLDAWLCVVALAWACGSLLIVLGGARYSLGWYVWRIDGLIGGSAVLVAMFLELLRSRESESVARRNAQYDHLTGLPNRALLAERIESALREAAARDTFVAVLFIDLDSFKLVNDTHGHAVGDEVLRITGQRLGSCIRDSDTVARLGGDEFIVVLGALRTAGDHAVIAEKLRAAVMQRCSVQQRELVISASIGVSICPTDARDAESLLRCADAALYRAKSMGRNMVVSYDGGPAEAAHAHG